MSLKTIIWWLLGFVRELKAKMTLAVLMGVMSAISVIMIPVTGALALSSLIKAPKTSLVPYIVVMVVCGLMRGVFRYFEQYLNHAVAFELLAIVRDKIFSVLRHLAPAKLQGKSSGDLIAMITSDVELLEVFFAHTVSPVAIAFITSLIGVIYLMTIDFRLALIALVAYASVGILIPLWAYRQRQNAGDDYKVAVAQLNQKVVESFSRVNEITQYQLLEKTLSQLEIAGSQVNQTNETMIDQGIWIQSFSEAGVFLFSSLMLAAGLSLQLSFDKVLISTVFMISSFGPTLALAGLGNALLSTFASARRLHNLVHEIPLVKEIVSESDFEYESVNVSDVSFFYPGANQNVLNHFDLRLPKTGLYGLMGSSGLGKSTLLKLLMRFWKVNSGRIELSDINIEQIDTLKLREHEGYMEQDTFLFEDTIRFNLTLGRKYSDDEIYDALSKASLLQWIEGYEDGLDSLIGGKQRLVSDGEKQRIGLARIFLHKAKLMLLDEPTSNLDYLNEQIIMHALCKEKTSAMIVLVSHRETAMEQVDECLDFVSLNHDHEIFSE